MYSASEAKRGTIKGQKAKAALKRKAERDKRISLEKAKEYAKTELKFNLQKVFKDIKKATHSGKHLAIYELGAAWYDDWNTTYVAELTRLITKRLIKLGYKTTYEHEVCHGVKFYDEATPESRIYYTIKISW